MPKIKNISNSVYKLQGIYTWSPGETLDVPDDVAAHVLDAQAGRFEVVTDPPVPETTEPSAEPPIAGAKDRQQRKGRARFSR